MATNNAVNTTLSGQTGTGAFAGSISPAFTTPNIGIPSAGTLTSCTGLPVSTGISGLGTGVATALGQTVTGSGSIVLATSPTLATPTLGAASATSLTFSSTSGIIGTTTNNSAAAGSVGEVITSTLASGSAVTLSSTITSNITSISLTAGDWDVWGTVWVVLSGTGSQMKGAVSTTSATLPAATGGSAFAQLATSLTTGFTNAMPVGFQTLQLASTTTVYLVVNVNFTVGSTAYGTITARRAR